MRGVVVRIWQVGGTPVTSDNEASFHIPYSCTSKLNYRETNAFVLAGLDYKEENGVSGVTSAP